MAEGTLHSSSFTKSSSSISSSCSLIASNGESLQTFSSMHPLTLTSIKQFHDLMRTTRSGSLPYSYSSEQNWCCVYSLEALKLTLDHIIEFCKIPRLQLFEEFPFSQYLSVLNAANKIPSTRPKMNIDQMKLALKKKELKYLIKFYKNRIQWLSTESRLFWGLVMGPSVAVVVESSDNLAMSKEGSVFKEYKNALKLLIEDQLINKDNVYFIKYGTNPSPKTAQGLPFTKFKTQCVTYATEWVSSLEGEGSCNLLDALKLALSLQNIDTILVILSTEPNQPLDIISSYMIDKLSGEKAPRLHLVSYNGTKKIQESFRDLATESNGHFHSYFTQQEGSDINHKVEDSDMYLVKEEIIKTEQILSSINDLKHGVFGDPLIAILRELSLCVEWEKDDDFPYQKPSTGDHCLVCPSSTWLINHGIEGEGQNLYTFLAPNAYLQLEDHVKITNSDVVSQVYDVMMPLLSWDDGSLRYLHVDVHGIESYLSVLENFIVNKLQARLSWLQSESRVPFGVVTETKVLVVVDSSYAVMGQILVLQKHLRMLLEEQLAHVQEFNLIGYGTDCRIWTTGVAEPHRQSLLQAWEWILGISPSGSSNLLSALKTVFESGSILEEDEENVHGLGIYLVISSMPDQTKDILCTYIEQITSGHNIQIHVIYYNTEPLVDPSILTCNQGGRCGSEEEMIDCLRDLARAGKGRFHHFRVSNTCESDDISEIMTELTQAIQYLETGRTILDEYREFCRRNVHTPTPELKSVSPDYKHHQAPPLYPRQTTSSLARMNVSLDKMDAVKAATSRPLSSSRSRKSKPCLKNYSFYTGSGLEKVTASEMVNSNSPCRRTKTRPLIPIKEEYVSSKQWISKYGTSALGLEFSTLIPKSMNNPNETQSKSRHKHRNILTYKHINQQGEVTELCVDLKGLKSYNCRVKFVTERYHNRIQWLNKDENKYFGVIVEQDALFLLDVSVSMTTHLEEMKESFPMVLNQMLGSKRKRYNLIAYSSSVLKWSDNLVAVNTENIPLSMKWLEDVKAGGNSCLLQGIRESLESGANGIYLITDGMADHTHEFLLNQLTSLRNKYGNDWRINTVGWYCTNSTTENFLVNLAHSSGGRFHCYPNISKGDDLALLSEEVSLAQDSSTKTKNYL